jgi:hypothetical protein
MVGVRMTDDLQTRIREWADIQDQRPPLAEAIRRLVEIGLTVKTKVPSKARAPDAAEVAECAIDKVKDPTVAEDEQASRKRRLLQDPEEFRAVRVGGPKTKRT